MAEQTQAHTETNGARPESTTETSSSHADEPEMSVGFVTIWFERGQAYVTRALREALEPDYDTYIFARTGEVNGEKRLRTDGAWNVPRLTTHPRYAIPPARLRSWVEENDLDVVIFNEEYDWDLVSEIKCTDATVLTYLDYYERGWKNLMRLYDGVLCSTLRSYRLISEVAPSDYIGWTVDLDLFQPQDSTPEYTFFHNAGWLGINYRKMTPAVLEAFDAISRKVEDVTLFVHAQAPVDRLPPQSRELVDRNDRITYHVETVPPPGLYHKGEVLLFPSKLEGLGLPLPEGLSCGLPAIVTDAPPMNEFVRDGYNGLLVEVAEQRERDDGIIFPENLVSKQDFALQMLRYVREPGLREELLANARTSAEEMFASSTFSRALRSALERRVAASA